MNPHELYLRPNGDDLENLIFTRNIAHCEQLIQKVENFVRFCQDVWVSESENKTTPKTAEREMALEQFWYAGLDDIQNFDLNYLGGAYNFVTDEKDRARLESCWAELIDDLNIHLRQPWANLPIWPTNFVYDEHKKQILISYFSELDLDAIKCIEY